MDRSEGEITHYAPHETGEEQDGVLDELADAVVLGLRDYCQKSGIQRIVLGLSGGIDSAVAACVAAEAVGPENVLGISMPSRFSSQHSIDDAKYTAELSEWNTHPFPLMIIIRDLRNNLQRCLIKVQRLLKRTSKHVYEVFS